MNQAKPYSKLSTIKEVYPDGVKKLEIGSGESPEPGYVHLDIQKNLPDLEILADVRKMPLPDNFVAKEIRAVHIMEHFCHPKFAGEEMKNKYGTTLEVLREQYRVLKPGGKLKIVTPDFEKISQSVVKRRIPFDWLQRWTVGGHLNEYDVHHWLWTMDDAKNWLGNAGFTRINDWNPIWGLKKLRLNWNAEVNSKEWHELEWYHWLFVEATK